MTQLALHPGDALGQLDALAQSPTLPARDAARCAQLANTLRRPARICLLGRDKDCVDAVVNALLAVCPEIGIPDWPNALELRHGPKPRAQLTLADGTTQAQDGWLTPDMLQAAPIFLQLDLPEARFEGRTFIALSLCGDPDSCRQALFWAARRSEIAVWCTAEFGPGDAAIWSEVPERLSHHAYLVELAPASAPAPRTTRDFTGTLRLIPSVDGTRLDLGPLLARLTADIDEARVADLDAAQMMLYRLRRFQPGDGAAVATGTAPTPNGHAINPEIRRVLSEPLLFLQRRTRALAEDAIWAEVEQDQAWPTALIKGCVDIADALRDRSTTWPDDLPDLRPLADIVEEACDTLVLLQMEGGTARAGDAVAVLWQLRLAFEQAAFPKGGAI